MDRLEAIGTFVAVADEGGLAAGGRRLGRSPAAVSRAIAFLEARLGARLLTRTTRVVRLTEQGKQYLATCRRILEQLEEAELSVAGDRARPRGLLSISAPLLFGRIKVRPLVDGFLDLYPMVQVRLTLLDRVVNLVDEGVDVAVRLGHLPDSSLVAVKVGEVRRVVCASPDYLKGSPPIREPADLAAHACVAFSQITSSDTWSFGPGKSGSGKFGAGAKGNAPRHVQVHPRLTVNNADAAIGSACEGRGVTCVLSYQIEDALRNQRLVLILEDFAPPPLPVHVVFPETRLATAKSRTFVDFIVSHLRAGMAATNGVPAVALPEH